MVNTRVEARVDGLKRELGEVKGEIGNLDVNLEALKDYMAEILYSLSHRDGRDKIPIAQSSM